MKMDQLEKAKGLLNQALSVALHNLGNGHAVQEAKSHMKVALRRLDDVSKKQTRRAQTQQSEHEKWWSNVVTGSAEAATSPVAQEAYQKSLQQLNSMIDVEKKKLEELEKQDINSDNGSSSLLTD